MFLFFPFLSPWLQGKDYGSSWYYLCQLDLGSTRDFRTLELLLEGWHNLDFRALLLTMLVGALFAPWQLFFRGVMALLVSVLPGDCFSEGVEIL